MRSQIVARGIGGRVDGPSSRPACRLRAGRAQSGATQTSLLTTEQEGLVPLSPFHWSPQFGDHDEARLRATALEARFCAVALAAAGTTKHVSGPEAATQQRAKAPASTTAGGIVGTRSSRRRVWGTFGIRSGRAHGEPAAFWARIRPFEDAAGRHLQGPGRAELERELPAANAGACPASGEGTPAEKQGPRQAPALCPVSLGAASAGTAGVRSACHSLGQRRSRANGRVSAWLP